MWKNREKLAKIFFIFFIFSVIISYSFIACGLDHECVGEDCNVCYEINLLKNIFDSLLISSLLYITVKNLICCILKISYIWQINYCLTPVKLKVKLTE